MNEGKYVFTQVTSLIPRQIFQRLVKKYNGDHRVRVFALVKTDLQKLVTEPQPLILNQDVKEPTLQIPPISATGSLKESEHICS